MTHKQVGANAWFGKGNSLDSLGRYDEAIPRFEKALEIAPRAVEAWFKKGNSHRSGKPARTTPGR